MIRSSPYVFQPIAQVRAPAAFVPVAAQMPPRSIPAHVRLDTPHEVGVDEPSKFRMPVRPQAIGDFVFKTVEHRLVSAFSHRLRRRQFASTEECESSIL